MPSGAEPCPDLHFSQITGAAFPPFPGVAYVYANPRQQGAHTLVSDGLEEKMLVE